MAPENIGELFGVADDATSKVAARHDEELAKTPALRVSAHLFGSLVYHAAKKLINRKDKTGEERPQDEAVILSCSRLFNECFAGYSLLRQGLVLQAIVLLRSTFEITSQAILFMERAELAETWLNGRRIAPREVRSLSRFAAAERDLYRKLSNLSHPNVEAMRYHTVPLPNLKAIALAYGGWFSPKSAGTIMCQFLFAQLVFLETYYAIYSEDLDAQGLLWRQETIAEVGADPASMGLGWTALLKGWRQICADLLEYYNRMPSDALSMSLRLDGINTAIPGEDP